MHRDYTVVITEDPETPGAFLANVPSLPGCHTWGNSVQHAIEMAKEAVILWLETSEDAADNRIPKSDRSAILSVDR